MANRSTPAPGDRLPPHDIEAEEAVIASCLVDPEVIPEVATTVQAGDFFREQNRWVFESIMGVYSREGASGVNQITVTHDLERREKLAEAGGPAYVSRLVTTLPTSVAAVHYAQIVCRCSTYRALIGAASHIVRRAHEVDPDMEKVLGEALSLIESVAERGLSDSGVTFLRDALREFADAPPVQQQGVLTGWPDVNKFLGCLRNGDLCILAARPSKGKTSAAMQVLRDVIVKGGKAGFLFSLEMSTAMIVTRLLSVQTGIDSRRIDNRVWNEQETAEINYAEGVLGDTRQWIDDHTRQLEQIELRAKAHKIKHALDIVVIDYLQLIEVPSKENRVQEVATASRRLKALAKDLGVPVLALAQLSRAIESRSDAKPMLSDLKESGALEQDADVVMFLHDTSKLPNTQPHRVDLIIAKQRNGPTGTVPMWFTPNNSRFKEMQTPEVEE